MKTTILSIVFLVAVAFTATAQPGEGYRSDRPERGMSGRYDEMRRDHLKLSDEQREAFKSLQMEMAKESKPLRDQLRELNAKHVSLTTTEKPDMNAIYTSIEEMGNVKTQLAKVKAKYHQQKRAQLTDEQLTFFDSRKGKMRMNLTKENILRQRMPARRSGRRR